MIPKLHTTKEAAAILTVSEKTVRRLIQRGDLQSIKVRGCIRVSEEAILAYIEGAKTQQTVETPQTRKPKPRHIKGGYKYMR